MITLTLTVEEARALGAAIRYIAGDPNHSPRGHIANVDRKLDHAGISHANLGAEGACLPFPATVGFQFQNYPNRRGSDRIIEWTPGEENA